MKMTLAAIVLFLLSAPMSGQMRIDAGIAAGSQPYEARGSQFLISPEVRISRGRLGLHYALDYTDLDSGGSMYASHLGLSYRWPTGSRLAVLAGAGPSYVHTEWLGGELVWHAQVELALRGGRLEWFARLRQYDYSLESFRIDSASPDGPALLAGVRVALRQ